MMWNAVALIVIAPLLSGSTSPTGGFLGDENNDRQAFRTVAEGAYSTVSQRTVAVLRSVDSWKAFEPKLRPAFSLGSIDWDKEQLLVIFAGERTSGGYRVHVTRITVEDGQAVVHATEVEPDRTCQTTQAVTRPFAVVAMPRSSQEPVTRWTTRTGPPC